MLQVALGSILVLAGWMTACYNSGTRWFRPVLIVAMDGLVPIASFVILAWTTRRPIFSGLFCFCAFAGFAFADRVKRGTLREPIVFTDMSEVLELFRHPRLYIPFAGAARVSLGFALALFIFCIAFAIEVPTLPFKWSSVFFSVSLSIGIIFMSLLFAKPWSALLRTIDITGNPVVDSQRYGPFATIGIYGIIARAERSDRQAAAQKMTLTALSPPHKPPVVLVQSESFFDVRRLVPDIPLPALEDMQRSSQWGRLKVSAWGANTTRSEFSALTGLTEDDIGFDRFNPYHAFATTKLPSLAWEFKNRGYETVCIHPFDRRFYRRDKVMPLLGFDYFIGDEAFDASDLVGNFVGDVPLAKRCEEFLSPGRPVFLFIISMQNHGPWPIQNASSLASTDAAGPSDFKTYLDMIQDADAMIALLKSKLNASEGGILCFYGDHLPSLSSSFDARGFREQTTDYFIWQAGREQEMRRDLLVSEIPSAILETLRS